MAEEFKNKIKRLELENFTCFGKVAMDFSPGINVFIGENGTGKTHLLKAILIGTNKEFGLKYPHTSNNGHTAYPNLTANLIASYYAQSVRPVNLIKKGTDKNKSAYIKLQKGELVTLYIIDVARGGHFEDFGYKNDGLFIPSQEMLSWFKGFVSSYENRESSIDPTYYMLAKALAPSRLKGEKLKKAQELISDIENQLGIEVHLDGDTFYIKHKTGEHNQAALEATGINKIAQLIWLILNGSLTKNTILLWDEPEANLNPKYILIVAKFLQTLANAGCQIFVATHDYLLPYELSLSKEYADVAEGKVPGMKFFSLYKGENGTEVEEGETMPDLRHDAIMDGAGRHNDREDILFRKSLNHKK